MKETTQPEIQRCNLDDTILLLKGIGIDNVNDFDYITARLDSGLIAFAKIESNINRPTILPNDEVALRRSEGYRPGDGPPPWALPTDNLARIYD